MTKRQYKRIACGIIAAIIRADMDNCAGSWAAEQNRDHDKLLAALAELAQELERREGKP